MTDPALPTPTKGRVVYYNLAAPSAPGDVSGIRAAIISDVNSDNTVALQVMVLPADHDPENGFRASVPLDQVNQSAGSYSWMPFQLPKTDPNTNRITGLTDRIAALEGRLTRAPFNI